MHPDKTRVQAFADYLSATGLYDSVELVSANAPTSARAASTSTKTSGRTGVDAVSDDLSKLFD